MVAKQSAKSPAKKKAKTTAKKKTTTVQKPKAAVASRPSEKGKNPAYVLIIMGLVTALALLYGKFYTPKKTDVEQPPKEKVTVEKKEEIREKSRKTRDAEEERRKIGTREEKTRKHEDIKTTPEKQTGEIVKIYFVALNEKTEKMYLAPVSRKVNREPLLENTIRELVKGPTAAEKKKGLLTAIPPELKINSIKIRNKTAEMDFNTAIEHGAAGSILLNRIDQIVYTATQFGGVASVIIKINGKTRQTLGADGLSIAGPLRRRQ